MSYNINYEKGIVNRGNLYRIKECMNRAEWGDRMTVGFLGGSITQGAVSSQLTNCYAYLVYEWWVKKFPKSAFTYVNAGIGGTSSQFGVARVESDLLKFHPDFALVEFSVNDENDDFFQETYEGLLRKVITSPLQPAVLSMHNMFYNDGKNAQEKHLAIAKHYEVPSVSVKDSVYAEIEKGTIKKEELTPDDLHPNTEGHRLVADLIIHFLEKVYEEREVDEEPVTELVEPITANQYENSVRYQNYNTVTVSDGFVADPNPQRVVADTFHHGWMAEKMGDSIKFLIKGTGIAIQYRKSVAQPAPVAVAIIDGDEENAITLDANFDETWGDCLYLQTALFHGDDKEHTVEIKLEKVTEDNVVPFYLVSVIGSN